MRFCNKCNVKKICVKCNNQVNENNEFKANLIEIKRHPPNEFGYMLPYYKVSINTRIIVIVTGDLFVLHKDKS